MGESTTSGPAAPGDRHCAAPKTGPAASIAPQKACRAQTTTTHRTTQQRTLTRILNPIHVQTHSSAVDKKKHKPFTMTTMTVTKSAKDASVHLVPVGLGLCDGASEQLLQQRQVVHLVSGSQRTRPAHRRGHVLRAGPALLAHHLPDRSIGK